MGAHARRARWQFRVSAWQPGSYLATATNTETGRSCSIGNLKGECPTQREGKTYCEVIFRNERDKDRAAGIRRGV